MNESLERVFEYDGRWQVRTVVVGGEPWFVAKDVCGVLDIGNSRQATERLDEDEKGVITTDTLGGQQAVTIVSESGLYSLILTSRRPGAKAFKRWITHEVIPAIRKTGSYSTTLQFDIPKNYAEALRLAANLWEENQEQKATLAVMAPKAEFHDAVASSEDAQPVGYAAKVLGTGQNRLFARLRGEGILMDDNRPYQQYLNPGYFRVIEQTWTDSAGNVHLTTKTLVTGKGLAWLQKRLSGGMN